MKPTSTEISLDLDSESDLSRSANYLKLGRTLVQRLFILLKNARLYDTDNVSVQEAANRLVEIIQTIHAMDQQVRLGAVLGFLILNGNRLREDVTGHSTFVFLREKFGKHKLGEIRFGQGITPQDAIRLAVELVSPSDGPDSFGRLQERLRAGKLDHIHLGELQAAPKGISDEHLMKNLKKRSVSAFFRSIQTSREILSSSNPREINFRKAKRVIQNMVDTIAQEEFILLSLATIKNYDQYTFNHSSNVAIYSISLGQRLGLGRPALCDLGMAGIFHDVGKTLIPKGILNKPTMLAEEEWEVMKNHSVLGAEFLLKAKRLNPTVIRNILVAFEHHLNLDLDGYPQTIDHRELNFYSRIVAIADCFDALTTPRVYRKKNYTPQEALSIMMEGRGTIYDPVLLKVFVNLIGIHPIGSVVQLESGELAIVYQASSDSDKADKPLVKIFSNSDGTRVEERIVDLSQPDENGKTKNQIVKTLDPSEYFESIEDYLEVL